MNQSKNQIQGNFQNNTLQKVFSLHDRNEIQNLFSAAGFREISVRSETKTVRLPPPKEFLWQYVHSTPLAEPFAQVDEAKRLIF
jgi:hypothetical protein